MDHQQAQLNRSIYRPLNKFAANSILYKIPVSDCEIPVLPTGMGAMLKLDAVEKACHMY
jgi:hypothetical protein